MKKRALRQLSILMASILSLSLLDIFSPINAYAYGKDEPIIVVSMGDSYSSGEGIEPFYGQKENDDPEGKDLSRFDKIDNDDWLAHRSMYSWPSLLKVGDKAVREHKMPLNKSNGNGDSEMQWYFVAASGAVTWHFGGKNNDGSWWGEYPHKTVTNVGTVMHPWYETKSKNLDPQLKVFEDNELYGKVDYVTMSIGGNDLDFVDIIATSLGDTISTDIGNTVVDLLNKSLTLNVLKVPYIQSPGFIGKRIEDSKKKWNNPWTDKEGKEQKPVKDSLKDAYHRTIDFAGPQADIIVAGYPELYYRETDTATANKKQREIIDNFIIEMCNPVDGKIKEVIKECNTEFANGKIHYVSVIEEFKDKGMDAPGEQWIEGINFWGSEKLDESLGGIMGYSSAHPNKTGAEHYANLVNKKIEEIEESKLNGIISGKVVTENNKPIENAKVTANNKEVYTNANGEFSLSLPKGNYYFEVTCDGYQPAKIANINVQPGKTIKLNDIVLKNETQTKDKMYAAYLKEVKALINTYGGGKIVDDTSGNSSYKMTGLCYAKLIDFDNDGNEELLCVYGPTKDGDGYEKPYYMKVFGYDGNKVNSLFESGAFFFNYTDWSHRIAYCEDNGQTLLLTRKNPQTFEIYEWSELSGNEFKVVKSISDFNESDPGNIKYTVDNKEVSKADFDKQLSEWKNKQTYIIFNSNSKEILESNISETNNTLKTLGFVEDEWRTLYKNMLNNELKNLNNVFTYFNLYDVNNDGVPELFVKRQDGRSNYEDHYTVINDEVVEIAHGEYNGSSLINPKSEWIMHQCYSNGKFYQFYKFDNGKVIKSEIFRPESGSNGYSINGISVSENEFNTKLAKYDYGPYASIDTENSPWVGVFNNDYRAINPNITSMSGSFGMSDFEKTIDAWLPNA